MADIMDITSVDEAIARLSSDPNSMATIIENVKHNPEMFAELLSKIEGDPSLKNKAMESVMGNPKTKKDTMTMSTDTKNVMIANMKAARAAKREAMINCVRVTQNGMLKKFAMPGDFPKGTIFESGDIYTIDPDLCVFTTQSSRTKNKIATKMVGEDIFGELVICKQSLDTLQYNHYTLAEAQSLKDVSVKAK
jgi:hypothetical protein